MCYRNALVFSRLHPCDALNGTSKLPFLQTGVAPRERPTGGVKHEAFGELRYDRGKCERYIESRRPLNAVTTLYTLLPSAQTNRVWVLYIGKCLLSSSSSRQAALPLLYLHYPIGSPKFPRAPIFFGGLAEPISVRASCESELSLTNFDPSVLPRIVGTKHSERGSCSSSSNVVRLGLKV